MMKTKMTKILRPRKGFENAKLTAPKRAVFVLTERKTRDQKNRTKSWAAPRKRSKFLYRLRIEIS